MVSLATIALVSAITFAVMTSAREKAREATCMANLHQIGRAIQMYQQDYNGIEAQVGVPHAYYDLGLPGGTWGTITLFNDYIRDRRIVKCPSFRPTRFKSQGIISSYDWPGLDRPEGTEDFTRRSAKYGPEMSVAACFYHNGALDTLDAPRWEHKSVLVLRLNQQVQRKEVLSRDYNSGDW